MSKYFYTAFGLNICSDMCLPELLPGECTDDVCIICGNVPTKIDDAIWKYANFQLSNRELLFYVKGIAHYYVADGKKIIVQMDDDADVDSVKLYLLGTVLGTILLQRGILAIHGSAVVIDGRCIIFSGCSGAGKSTLSSTFRMMGYPFIADDVSVVSISKDGIPWVYPGYPQQKLCHDSLETMGVKVSNLTLIDASTEKYAVPVKNDFINEPIQLAAICELKPLECCGIEVKQLLGVEKLKMLISNIYRNELLDCIGMKPEYFKQCLQVTNTVPFFRLERPKGIFTLEEQVNIIREKCLI